MKELCLLAMVLFLGVVGCGSKITSPLENIKCITGGGDETVRVITDRVRLDRIAEELASAELQPAKMVAAKPDRIIYAGKIEYTNGVELSLDVHNNGFIIIYDEPAMKNCFIGTARVSVDKLRPLFFGSE